MKSHSTPYAAARLALKGLATRYLKVILFKFHDIVESLNEDARLLLGIYSGLLSDDFSERTISQLDEHRIIQQYIDSVWAFLRDDELQALALITEHCDAWRHMSTKVPHPLSLLKCFTKSINQVCKIIVGTYNRHPGQEESGEDLAAKFRSLVRPTFVGFLYHFQESLCYM